MPRGKPFTYARTTLPAVPKYPASPAKVGGQAPAYLICGDPYRDCPSPDGGEAERVARAELEAWRLKLRRAGA